MAAIKGKNLHLFQMTAKNAKQMTDEKFIGVRQAEFHFQIRIAFYRVLSG